MAILEYVIYPKGGLVATGVRFVTSTYHLPMNFTEADVLHAWWCSLTLDEVKSMFKDGITLDRIRERVAVLKLGDSK